MLDAAAAPPDLATSHPRARTNGRGAWSGQSARSVSTWVAPVALGLVAGIVLLLTPLTWADAGGVLPSFWETQRLAYGDGYVPTLVLLVTVPMGLCAVAGVALSRARPLLAMILVVVPLAVAPLVGVFVWGWWLAALLAAAVLAYDGVVALWPTLAAVVAVAVWYCVSGAAALTPVGAVTAGTDPSTWGTYVELYLASVTVVVGLAGIAGALLRWQERVRSRVEVAETEAHEAFEAEAATSERARAARDLHDVVAHHVSLVAVRAESAPYVHPELDATARAVLGDIANDARDALDELRQVLTILQRAGHEDAPRLPQPGSADVASLVADARAAGQDVELAEPVPTLPAAQGYVVYRAVQEALTNARRHAPGRVVRVEVAVRSGVVGVRVTNPLADAGSGTPDAGRGLLGMRERAEALGGAADHAVDDGTFVLSVSLPLAPGEEER